MSRSARSHPRRHFRRTAAIVVAFASCLTACGGSDDDSSPVQSVPTDQSEPAASSGDELVDDAFALGDAGDLVVPLDYLQGEWCNTDGEAWVFDGETARFGETHDELIGELPVALAFQAGVERVLVSQTDDEFVLDLQSRLVTFTRGSC